MEHQENKNQKQQQQKEEEEEEEEEAEEPQKKPQSPPSHQNSITQSSLPVDSGQLSQQSWQQQQQQLEKENEEQEQEQQKSQSSSPTMNSSPSGLHHYHNSSNQSLPPLDSPPYPDAFTSDQTSHNHVFFPPPERSPPSAKHPSPGLATRLGPRVADRFSASVEDSKLDGAATGCSGGVERRLRPDFSMARRANRDAMVKRALLVFRFCGFVFCLVSFSVMAADRDQGWALDSFYKYKEFRYCMAVNVLGFVYSSFQVAYQLMTGKQKSHYDLRHFLDFATDQILTYLLISASSSAAVRVADWQSNWGADKFPQMAKASVTLSFLAFVALAFSSLISGYALCTLNFM
ncbi:CASP-like protein 4A1 [Carica papaya]|uniref:CASP-like protein 4A1 n=1 Tax=Carica papaya TaxID=3649 RepID=UPI000B8CB4F9|nr:CASP-like protein 4A1 [Carica papaya]